jgi:hypothetical protein
MRPLARLLLQLYPASWRRRYEAEVVELLSRTPRGAGDLFDLLRGALEERERQLACVRWRVPKVLLSAYGALVVVLIASITLNALVQGPGRFSSRAALVLTSALFWNVFFYLPIYLAGLAVHAPVLLGLRLARRRVSVAFARAALAAGFAAWFEWAWYQMEWFDVWRHGFPGVPYLLLFMVPQGLAFAAAGAIIGSAVVRDRDGRPAPWKVAG